MPASLIAAACGLTREAAIAAAAGLRPVPGGGDAARLAAGLEALVTAGARGIVSLGIAGGLDPGLACGDAVVADAVLAEGCRFPTDPAWAAALRARLPAARTLAAAGVAVPVADVAGKRRLFTAGAGVVDMESQVAAMVAARYGLPLAVLRVVGDPAHRALPPAALVGMGADGRPNVGAVLRSLAARPGQLPDLLRTAGEAARAFRSLADCCRAASPALLRDF